MSIEIQLRLQGQDTRIVKLEHGDTVGDLLAEANVESAGKTITVNGGTVNPSTILNDGDVVSVAKSMSNG